MMEILHTITGPLVGAVIGYLTNYIAVKMLFRPFYPVMIGKWQLPFTPGIIPKRRAYMASALGKMVGDQLITKDDLKSMVASDSMRTSISKGVVSVLEMPEYSSIHRIGESMELEESYENTKKRVIQKASSKLIHEVKKMDIKKIFIEEGTKLIKEKVRSNVMLSMMVSDHLIESIMEPMGDKVDEFISLHGQEKVQPLLEMEAERYEDVPILDILKKLHVEQEDLEGAVGSAYDAIVDKNLEELVEKVQIPQIVEDKINAMDIKEIEQLVLSVMKKELSSIVNLGALIGFLIGIINIFL